MWSQFKKYQPGQADTLGEPYDKKSIMHYGNYAFTKYYGQKTIVSLSNSKEKLGQRKELSVIDVKQLLKYYKCNPPKCVPDKDNHPSFCSKLTGYCTNAWVAENCKLSCSSGDKCKKVRYTLIIIMAFLYGYGLVSIGRFSWWWRIHFVLFTQTWGLFFVGINVFSKEKEIVLRCKWMKLLTFLQNSYKYTNKNKYAHTNAQRTHQARTNGQKH